MPVSAEGGASRADHPASLVDELFAEGYKFEFFQAVRLLERLLPSRQPVGRRGPPTNEVARFRALADLNFPPSAIHDVARPTRSLPLPTMTVTFLGLTGPSGVLPRHYTELLIQQQYRSKDAERFALRDWFDLFNHRFVSFFYRAWEKYRFFIPYEREAYDLEEPDPFSLALYSLIGLGTSKQRRRLRVAVWRPDEPAQAVASIDDLSLMYYAGLLAPRARSAAGLSALLNDYFHLPISVHQFQGQWLMLASDEQTQLGLAGGHGFLGQGALVGGRVWDVQGRIRIRIGPLDYPRFVEFLPDRTASPERKAYFLLLHLVRFYVGPELDLELQLSLAPGQVPECQLTGDGIGSRLGWNTWLTSQPPRHEVDDVVLSGEELTWVNASDRLTALGLA